MHMNKELPGTTKVSELSTYPYRMEVQDGTEGLTPVAIFPKPPHEPFFHDTPESLVFGETNPPKNVLDYIVTFNLLQKWTDVDGDTTLDEVRQLAQQAIGYNVIPKSE